MFKFKKIHYVYLDGWAAEGTESVSASRRPRGNLTLSTNTTRTLFLKVQLMAIVHRGYLIKMHGMSEPLSILHYTQAGLLAGLILICRTVGQPILYWPTFVCPAGVKRVTMRRLASAVRG